MSPDKVSITYWRMVGWMDGDTAPYIEQGKSSVVSYYNIQLTTHSSILILLLTSNSVHTL